MDRVSGVTETNTHSQLQAVISGPRPLGKNLEQVQEFAMSFPKKRLSMKGSPTSVLEERPESFHAADLAGLINSNEIKLDETRAGKRTFFEDFMLEHSLSGPQVTSIAGSF